MATKLCLAVLLPAFNAEASIKYSIASTLDNLPGNSKIYVLDDGSTDRTRQVVNSIKDPRVILSPEQHNAGVANALNFLLGESDSTYVARMDADDLCLSGRFERQLKVLRGGSYSACFTSVIHWRSPIWRSRPMLPVRLMPSHTSAGLLVENVLAHSTMMARRDVLERAGGPYRPGPAEDYDLWLRLIAAGEKIVRLATPGVAYRSHSNQVTAQAGWEERVSDDQLLQQSYWDAVAMVLGSGVSATRSAQEVYGKICEMSANLRREGWAGGALVARKARAAQRRLIRESS